jgi:hypothetical protein
MNMAFMAAISYCLAGGEKIEMVANAAE